MVFASVTDNSVSERFEVGKGKDWGELPRIWGGEIYDGGLSDEGRSLLLKLLSPTAGVQCVCGPLLSIWPAVESSISVF
jgi:hypothetical protein